MAENSHISWTDHTFNPWMGCTKVSPACTNCYAERDMDHRYGKVSWGPNGTRVKTTAANWRKPLKWNREQVEYLPLLNDDQSGRSEPMAFGSHDIHRPLVFCASLADVFEDWTGPILNSKGERLSVIQGACEVVTTMDDLRRDLFALIDATPNLDWLLLTKRPENVARMWPLPFWTDIYPDAMKGATDVVVYRKNVWLGTSIENQEWTDRRLPHLHAAKRNGLVSTTFVSAEPLVGPIMLQGNIDGRTYNHLGEGGIDWVITGGESGPGARPCKPEWFRSLRDQCAVTGTPFHFKQYGEFDENQIRVGKKAAGRLLDGVTHDAFPDDLKVRGVP